MTDARPLALVSGGSSGIGFEVAAELVRRGYRVAISARGLDRLEIARRALEEIGGAGSALAYPLDVADSQACAGLAERLEAEVGPVEMLVTSAGIAEPGLFLEQPLEAHIRQMQVNYFGTLALVRALAPGMARRGRGHIVLISSGAAFVGIYGYSAYAPSKFAVRCLAETLRTELSAQGVTVSVAFPPDTETPQYEAEQAAKPAATKAISAGGGLYGAKPVALRIVDRALRGKFVITHGAPLLALHWLHSLYGPFFLRYQQWVARRLGQ